MPPSFKGKKKKIKYVGSVRKSKLTRDAGIGAIVEFPGFSGMMAGQNKWPSSYPESMILHEKMLEDNLKKDFFLQVVSEEDSEQYKNACYLPVVRFPSIYYCPECRELDYVNKLAVNFKSDTISIRPLRCNNCNAELLPSRFIVSCEDGHVDEFPYSFWAHRGHGRCDRPRLKLENIGKTGGLESLRVTCETCNASNTLASCFAQDALSPLKCMGKSVWLGDRYECECGKPIRTLMRNSNNVYYPKIIRTLTIPPWSNNLQLEINKNYNFYKSIMDLGESQKAIIETLLLNRYTSERFQDRYEISSEDYIKQVFLRFTESKERVKSTDLIKGEYKALTGKEINDIYFKSERTSISEDISEFFSQVKLIKRLREVQVLTGFTRIKEVNESGFYCPLSSKNERWLPAVELLGEGIYIEFSKEKLLAWSELNGHYYDKLNKRYIAKDLQILSGRFSPIYVLVHSFSHLFIRELSFVSGYDTSSIKEKVYVNDDQDNWMAGVLIYTAASSSDGSLGGLVRQGKKENFQRIIHSMLDRAQWCSNDPICRDSTAQGYNSLNYGACYSCTLLPEISCENMNILLDRNALVGDSEHGVKGYFYIS